MHKDNHGLISSLFGGMDTDTALIMSLILLLKKQGGHDMLLPALLYILM